MKEKRELAKVAKSNFLRNNSQVFFLWLIVFAMLMIGAVLSEGFLNYRHLGDILRTSSFLGFVAIGQTLVILTGGIDLSVGTLITMGNVFICMFLNGLDTNNIWAIPLLLFIGLFVGVFNGFGVAILHISPFVMTLAVGSLITGITLIFSQGAPKGLASPWLRQVGVGYLFDSIPIIVLIWFLLSMAVIAFLRLTVPGRKIYYYGANAKTAFLSGVDNNLTVMLAYGLSGFFAVLSGVLMAGYTQTAFLGIGNEYVNWSIAAVVIGGTSLSGGKGGYAGAIPGAIILILLEGILTIVRIPEAGRKIANGLIILVMITIYLRNRKK